MNNEEENKEVAPMLVDMGDDIELDVFVDPDENIVYVKFANFDELEDAEEYAEYLIENLPLLLFQSKVIH